MKESNNIVSEIKKLDDEISIFIDLDTFSDVTESSDSPETKVNPAEKAKRNSKINRRSKLVTALNADKEANIKTTNFISLLV